MNYTCVQITADNDWQEIWLASLSAIGFESFEQTQSHLFAYIPENLFSETTLQTTLGQYGKAPFYKVETIAAQNWNSVWEANFQPIVIADECLVRSPYHQIEQVYPYEIIIQPKMSFGTGHHSTTSLMISHQLELDHTGKKVLDVGCGTGILAIMALKLHAILIDAIDTDDWAVANTQENLEQNDATQIQVKKGSIYSIPASQSYDIILANINRNVLLEEIPDYVQRLVASGYLLLSGFYEQDIDAISEAAQKQGLVLQKTKIHNHWSSLVFQKKP